MNDLKSLLRFPCSVCLTDPTLDPPGIRLYKNYVNLCLILNLIQQLGMLLVETTVKTGSLNSDLDDK